jgi:hypothetical protein
MTEMILKERWFWWVAGFYNFIQMVNICQIKCKIKTSYKTNNKPPGLLIFSGFIVSNSLLSFSIYVNNKNDKSEI